MNALGIRRFRRLTNGCSKKIENHRHAVSLYYMFYNFSRIQQTTHVTPAMDSIVADHPWKIEEIVGLLKEEAVVILR